MSLARLRLTEIAPDGRVPVEPPAPPLSPPEETTEAPDVSSISPEALSDAVQDARLEGYSEGFAAGVTRTRDALSDEAQALDTALIAALSEQLRSRENTAADVLRTLRPALEHLLDICMPEALHHGFTDKVIAHLAAQLPRERSEIVLAVHTTQAEHLTARLAQSDLPFDAIVESDPDLAPNTARITIGAEATALRPNIALAQAKAELDALFATLDREFDHTDVPALDGENTP
jgi:hypothetical protein